MAASWFSQLTATLRRNCLIKLRDGSQTFQEIFLPVYIIVLLILIKLISPEVNYAAVPLQPLVNEACEPVEFPSAKICLDLPQRETGEVILAYTGKANPAITELVGRVVTELQANYSSLPGLQTLGFDRESELEAYYDANAGTVFAGIVFDGVRSKDIVLPAKLDYRIRMNGTYVPYARTDRVGRGQCRPAGYEGTGLESACDSQKYITSGFLAIQSAVAHAAAAMSAPVVCGPSGGSGLSAEMRQQALLEYHESFASSSFQLFAAMYLVWALAPLLQITLSHIVHEKEALVKACMLHLGLRESIYWLGWGIVFAIMSGFTAAIVVVAAKYLALFQHSSPLAVFLIIWPYSLSIIAMAFALSIVVAKVRVAGVVASLLMLLGSLVIIPVKLLHWGSAACLFLSLFSPIGLTVAVVAIVRAEGTREGVHMNQFWSPMAGLDVGDEPHPLSLGVVLIMFCLDTAIYATLAWYLDKVWPQAGEEARQPWNFVFSKQYWRASKPVRFFLGRSRAHRVSLSEFEHATLSTDPEDNEEEDVFTIADAPEYDWDTEPVAPEMQRRAAVVVCKLKKTYPKKERRWWQWWTASGGAGARSGGRERRASLTGHKGGWDSRELQAVKGLDLTLYEGQCFAFLGHSGSGKSTLLNILAGFSQATSGEVYVYGNRLKGSGPEVRSMVGVCRQQDIAIGWLTVSEQLEYFAAIRGEPKRFARGDGSEPSIPVHRSPAERAQALVRELGLQEDTDRMGSSLTPSSKRKLSLAIAMIGDPQVLLVDEPTAGMDSRARKQVWDVLLQRRKTRVVVIATQSMEEADLAADRKAILSHGVLKCCGSSLFLRNRFGLSYMLHVTKGEDFRAHDVATLVQGHLSEAVALPGVRGQDHVTYRLPLGRHTQISALLMDLTAKSAQLGVVGGALEATTLEEVFLQFQDEGEEDAGVLMLPYAGAAHDRGASDKDAADDLDAEETLLGKDDHRINGVGLDMERKPAALLKQAMALVKARARIYRRNPGSILSTFGVPLVISFVAFLVLAAVQAPAPAVRVLLDSRVGNSIPVYYATGAAGVSDAAVIMSHIGPNVVREEGTDLMSRFRDGANGRGLAVGIEFQKLDLAACSASYSVYYQPWQVHQLPSVVAMVDAAIVHEVQTLNSSDPNSRVVSLRASTHPLPYEKIQLLLSYLVSLVVTLVIILIPPVLCAQLVSEVESGVKSLLQINGLRPTAHWLACFITDTFCFFLTAFLILSIGTLFGHAPFVPGAFPALLALFVFSIPANLSLAYVWSFFYDKADVAASWLSMLFMLIAIVPYFVFVLAEDTFYPTIHYLLAFVDPPYALLSGIHYAALADARYMELNGAGPSPVTPASFFLRWDTHILSCIAGSAAALCLLVARLWHLERRSHDIDAQPQADAHAHALRDDGSSPRGGRTEDVEREMQSVVESSEKWEAARSLEGDGEEGVPLLLHGLGKVFGAHDGVCGLGADEGTPALRDVWLGVSHGEVVVLLGGERSGKSTLLLCLTGAIPLSQGDALVAGHSVRFSYQYRPSSVLGFCPEGEILYNSLTVKEHLDLYAAVKGVPEPAGVSVEEALTALKLGEDANRRAGECKPGTLRRLSLAISTLGGPGVLLLDQPSLGMDDKSRRELWKRIVAESKRRATLVCTQSVEEAEALATRVGIMVNGELKCLGSPQELKRKYGSNYTLLISARPDKLPAIREFITTLFPTAPQEEEDFSPSVEALGEQASSSGGQTRFKVPVEGLADLAMLVHELDIKRGPLGIEDFSVSQPTLQQVFARLSKGAT